MTSYARMYEMWSVILRGLYDRMEKFSIKIFSVLLNMWVNVQEIESLMAFMRKWN